MLTVSITTFNTFGYIWSRRSVNTSLHSVTRAGKRNNVLIISYLSFHPRYGKSHSDFILQRAKRQGDKLYSANSIMCKPLWFAVWCSMQNRVIKLSFKSSLTLSLLSAVLHSVQGLQYYDAIFWKPLRCNKGFHCSNKAKHSSLYVYCNFLLKALSSYIYM